MTNPSPTDMKYKIKIRRIRILAGSVTFYKQVFRKGANMVWAIRSWLISWSLTSLFSTNMAISETNLGYAVLKVGHTHCLPKYGILP